MKFITPRKTSVMRKNQSNFLSLSNPPSQVYPSGEPASHVYATRPLPEEVYTSCPPPSEVYEGKSEYRDDEYEDDYIPPLPPVLSLPISRTFNPQALGSKNSLEKVDEDYPIPPSQIQLTASGVSVNEGVKSYHYTDFINKIDLSQCHIDKITRLDFSHIQDSDVGSKHIESVWSLFCSNLESLYSIKTISFQQSPDYSLCIKYFHDKIMSFGKVLYISNGYKGCTYILTDAPFRKVFNNRVLTSIF
jgi:hypothetical protein